MTNVRTAAAQAGPVPHIFFMVLQCRANPVHKRQSIASMIQQIRGMEREEMGIALNPVTLRVFSKASYRPLNHTL